MNTIGGYFLNRSDDGVSIKENVITGKKYRITILTDRLVRLEYSSNGIFEDRTTNRVIYRKFPKVDYQISQTDMLLQITTSYFTLDYVKEKPFSSGKLVMGGNFKITLNGTDKVWYYGHPEARNFGGISYSLDNFSGSLKLEKGLYSTDGFACIDDSDSLVLDDNGNFIVRETKELDIYVFMYKKDLGLCLQDYYTLTGYPMLLPRYAYGTWWYKNTRYTKEELDNLFNKFAEEKTPLSALLLGSWHLDNDPLMFDENYLSGNILKELSNKYNVKTGLSINPELKVREGSLTYQNISNNVSDLKKEYSFLPLSLTNLNLYSTYGIRNFIGMGIDNFIIDYNNKKDKNGISILSHYCYAMNSLLSNKRSVIFTRNHNVAAHRNTVLFTGYTKVDWNTLTVLPRYNATASNNGISYVASTIGGYYGGIENYELYIRYIQLGVFSSILLLGSDKGEYYKREPWRWNQAVSSIIKKYLNLRNSLIPYIYTESYIYHKSGSPIIQPLYYKYPKIYDEPNYKNQYFFGSEMLVCPITKKKNTIMNRVVQRMFIPEGVWYEFESGKKYLGNKYYMSFYKDEDYPVFCREGAIIPMSLDNGTNLPINMEIIVFPGSDGSYKLYEDDGITNNYKNNTYAITEIMFMYRKESYELVMNNTSNPGILPQVRNYRVRFKNTRATNVVITNGGVQVQGNVYLDKNDLVIDVSNIGTSREFKIECTSDSEMENSTIHLINDDIRGILEDLEIETTLKERIGSVLFSNLSVKKKRIAIRKLKKYKLEPKFVKMFLNLLEYIDTV